MDSFSIVTREVPHDSLFSSQSSSCKYTPIHFTIPFSNTVYHSYISFESLSDLFSVFSYQSNVCWLENESHLHGRREEWIDNEQKNQLIFKWTTFSPSTDYEFTSIELLIDSLERNWDNRERDELDLWWIRLIASILIWFILFHLIFDLSPIHSAYLHLLCCNESSFSLFVARLFSWFHMQIFVSRIRIALFLPLVSPSFSLSLSSTFSLFTTSLVSHM